MSYKTAQLARDPTAPASFAAAVDLSSTDATYTEQTAPLALYVGGAGDVKVDMAGAGGTGGTVTFSAVPAGTVLPACVRKVYRTGTTATLIIALSNSALS